MNSEDLRQRRIHSLRDSAAERAADAQARARRAITLLDARGEVVTFTTVAETAHVSQSYLYKQADLATEIRRRRVSHRPGPVPNQQPSRSGASEASLRTQLGVAVARLRAIEADNRQMRSENEVLRGEVLALRRKSRSRDRQSAEEMAGVTLTVNDAAELAEALQFLRDWLARDDDRAALAFADYVGHPAYGTRQLTDDLDRFIFLLGGDDEGRFLVAAPSDPAGSPDGNC